ncbi:hypothetical protein GCM10025777_16630 [Membranihabitans marinus]
MLGSVGAQNISNSFEMRYITKDTAANDETDFKGTKEWMNTDERIKALHAYADFASDYFGNRELDKKIVLPHEVDSLISNFKKQPLPKVRREYVLDKWKSYGYRKGQEEEEGQNLASWQKIKGVTVEDGKLILNNASVERSLEELNWRFKLEGRFLMVDKESFTLSMGNDLQNSIEIQFTKDEIQVVSNGENLTEKVELDDYVDLTLEVDMSEKRFNVLVNGHMIWNFIPISDLNTKVLDRIRLESNGLHKIDELAVFNYIPNPEDERMPYLLSIAMDEDFEQKKNVMGWQSAEYDDSHWQEVSLPAVHGGLREAGEDLYLRKVLSLDSFDRAILEIASLDPGGEIWINGEIAAVIDTRHPIRKDVSGYCKPNTENIIAIRVKPYRSNHPMLHAPSDRNIGWFLDQTKLITGSQCMITDLEVHTTELDDAALQSHKVGIHYPQDRYFKGELEINYYNWHPEEGEKIASISRAIEVRPRIDNYIEVEMSIENPELWTTEKPNLYKVEAILKNENGEIVDDKVITTGIRTVDQGNGYLYVNGQPEMLNGVQIMGFRTPVENLAKYNRCPPLDIVAEEMLMTKKMGANLLRVHVHAEQDTVDGVNDRRYAELADQMGIYLIWSTAGFIREGEAWNVDFEGYPKYMAEVYNHPSIVMWEASNHPNRFKEHDVSDSRDYIDKIYEVIYQKDESRLISPTSFWQHSHFANYDGTKDKDGNTLEPPVYMMADRMTRGSQDAYTGYGASWSGIRKAPNPWAASCLSANDKAYFNFEHEESAAQPNWDLSKGKPWYKVQSYEWGYEKGSIGRKLDHSEWRASQAWQAFSAWESMKKQMLLGYDGFSWCSLRGGANMGTYQKPLIDNLGHPKLAYYVNKMVFQRTWAGSDNVDVVYGPDDLITPVIHHLGESQNVNLTIRLLDEWGAEKDRSLFENIMLEAGRSITKLESFAFPFKGEGLYFIEYQIEVE